MVIWPNQMSSDVEDKPEHIWFAVFSIKSSLSGESSALVSMEIKPSTCSVLKRQGDYKRLLRGDWALPLEANDVVARSLWWCVVECPHKRPVLTIPNHPKIKSNFPLKKDFKADFNSFSEGFSFKCWDSVLQNIAAFKKRLVIKLWVGNHTNFTIYRVSWVL